jgi:hypothetical protein
MSRPLFPLSTRPDVVVDPFRSATEDPPTQTQLGYQGPFGRERTVVALPSMDPDGPQLLEPPQLLCDPSGFAVGDPAGNALGQPGLTVHRLLVAMPTDQTRRF